MAAWPYFTNHYSACPSVSSCIISSSNISSCMILHSFPPVNCIGRGRGRGGGSSRPARTRRTAVCAANELPRGASRDNAISARGHSKRGRVKQKGSKKADLVEAGAMVFDRAWCNAGERGGGGGEGGCCTTNERGQSPLWGPLPLSLAFQ